MRLAAKVLMVSAILWLGLPAALFAQPQPPAPPLSMNPSIVAAEFKTTDEQGVDLIYGTFNHQVDVVSIGSGDHELKYSMIYSGAGLTTSLTGNLLASSATVNGSQYRFNSAGKGITDPGQTLFSDTPTQKRMVDRDGTVAIFNPNVHGYWNLTKLTRADGRELRYVYRTDCSPPNSACPLLSVTSNYGFQIKFATNEAINLSVDYSDPNSLQMESRSRVWPTWSGYLCPGCTLQTAEGAFTVTKTDFPTNTDQPYPTISLVTAFTDPQGSWNVGYSTQGHPSHNIYYFVSSVSLNGTFVSKYSINWYYSYEGYNAQITSSKLNVSGATMLSLSSDASLTNIFAARPKTVTNALGGQAVYSYDGYQGPAGAPIVLKSVKYPESNMVTYNRDQRGNVISEIVSPKAGTGLPDLIRTVAFPTTCVNYATCNKPIYEINAGGGRTDYEYDAVTGQRTKILQPPDVNGLRATTYFTYIKRHANIRTAANGVYISDPVGISLLASQSICRTVENCIGTPEEVRTTYEYGLETGPNNLLLRATVVTAGGEFLRTCYAYDDLGNTVSTTGPRAGLASCL